MFLHLYAFYIYMHRLSRARAKMSESHLCYDYNKVKYC
jgi:hypothetical protein